MDVRSLCGCQSRRHCLGKRYHVRHGGDLKDNKQKSHGAFECHVPHHIETLIGEISSLISRDGVDSTTLSIFFRGLPNLGDTFRQLIAHGAVKYWLSNAVAEIKRLRVSHQQLNQEAILEWVFTPTNRQSMPGTFAIASTYDHCQMSANESQAASPTFCSASLVSICTIVTKFSLDCCR